MHMYVYTVSVNVCVYVYVCVGMYVLYVCVCMYYKTRQLFSSLADAKVTPILPLPSTHKHKGTSTVPE